MSMDHIEENYVKSLESRVKELETTLARAELQIKDWVNFLQRAKEENSRLRKVIDETCPRSSECSKMSKVVEAAREYKNAPFGNVEAGKAYEAMSAALRELDREEQKKRCYCLDPKCKHCK